MIDSLFTDEKEIAVLDWLISHPNDFHPLSSIAFDIMDTNEINITPADMAQIIHILELFDIIIIKEEDSLFQSAIVLVKLNMNSDITKLLIQLHNTIEDYVISFAVDSKFASEYNEAAQHPFAHRAHSKVDTLNKEQCAHIATRIENWRDNMEEPDNPIEKVMYHEIKEAFEEMEKNGDFEDFLQFVKNSYKLNS